VKRREFIAGIGGAAAWPLAARAQDGGVRRVGVLMAGVEADPEMQSRIQIFRQALTGMGWVEGSNVRFDERWTGSDLALQQSHARALVALTPDVILATTTTTTQALQQATQTIPIVFVTLSDPVRTGVVSNLARPEGNITGFTPFEYSMAGKWISLLKEVVPQLSRVAQLNLDVAPFTKILFPSGRGGGPRYLPWEAATTAACSLFRTVGSTTSIREKRSPLPGTIGCRRSPTIVPTQRPEA
jgi:putative ABC transport system substrate-binding protein